MHRMAGVLLLLVALSSVPALRFRLGPRTATSMEEVLMVESPGTRVEEKFHLTKTGLKMQFLVSPSPVDSFKEVEPQVSRAIRAISRLYVLTQDLVPAYDLPSRAAPKPKQVPGPRSPPGPRPPLLFVHGSYHSSWCWAEHFLPYFSSKGFSCYAVSLRGTGPTGMGPNAAASVQIQEHVEDLGEALEFITADLQSRSRSPTLAAPKPVLVAHSLGGLVAMKLLERPELRAALGGVCLLCSVPPSGNGPMVGRFVRSRFVSALKIFYGFVFKAIARDAAIARELFFDASVSDEDLARYLGHFERDSRVGLDIQAMAPVLPSRVSMDAAGRAAWLAEAGAGIGGAGNAGGGVVAASGAAAAGAVFVWDADAQKELDTIPFFVRDRIRGKTERYAVSRGLSAAVSLGVFLEAKKFYGGGGVIEGNTGTGEGTGAVYPSPGFSLNAANPLSPSRSPSSSAPSSPSASPFAAPSPRLPLPVLVVGGERDYIIDAEGTRETARYLGVEAVTLPVYHDCMVGGSAGLTAKCIEDWLQGAFV